VTNVISFEFYLQNSQKLVISSDFTLSAWMPVEDGEGTINWGYDLLKPVLDKLGCKIYTSSTPYKNINTDINIFLAHGETGSFGFRAVHG
jgi:hypothetical protein